MRRDRLEANYPLRSRLPGAFVAAVQDTQTHKSPCKNIVSESWERLMERHCDI